MSLIASFMMSMNIHCALLYYNDMILKMTEQEQDRKD